MLQNILEDTVRTITYHSNDERDLVQYQYVPATSTGVKVLEAPFIRTGFVIKGYSTSDNGVLTYLIGETIDSSVTDLYAVWVNISVASIYLAGGSGGGAFQSAVKSVPGVNNDLTKITKIAWGSLEAYQSNINNCVNLASTGEAINAWFDRDSGTLYLYCVANSIELGSDCSEMFKGFEGLTTFDISVDLGVTNTNSVMNCKSMFENCSSLTTLDLSAFKTPNVTNMQAMFSGNVSLTSLDISNFNTSKVETFSMFLNDCQKLSEFDTSKINTGSCINCSQMFRNCLALDTIDISSFDTSKVTNMRQMFSGCQNAYTINVSGIDTSKVTDFYWMFLNCNSISELDLSSFNTSSGTEFSRMFAQCGSLTTIYATTDFVVDSNDTSTDMFLASSSLVGGAGFRYVSSKINGTYAWIDGYQNKDGYFSEKYSRITYVYNDGTQNYDTISFEKGSTTTIAGAPYTRPNYEFLGWSLHKSGFIDYEPESSYSGSSVLLYAVWEIDSYEHEGEMEFDGTNVVDTNVRLFSEENANKNFEISFHIHGIENSNIFQASFVSCKNETTNPQYGITLRLTNSGSTFKYNLTATIGNGSNISKTYSISPGGDKLKLVRLNGLLYLCINDGALEYIADYSDFTRYFDLPVTIGSSIGSDLEYFRYYKGLISDVSIKLGDQVNPDDYTMPSLGDDWPMVFGMNRKTFNGTSDYIDTGICLFSEENKNKDCKISFIIEDYDPNGYTKQNTIFNSNYEVESLGWPGFKFRMSNKTTGEMSGKGGTNIRTNTKTLTNGLKVNIYRIGGVVSIEYDDSGTLIDIHNFNNYKGTFNVPASFGCSMSVNTTNNTYSPQRYFKGTLSNMIIRLDGGDE